MRNGYALLIKRERDLRFSRLRQTQRKFTPASLGKHFQSCERSRNLSQQNEGGNLQ
jgi:hypothetical protein